MARVSTQIIVQAAGSAGWRGNDLVTSVAVALAESSGDASATHHNTNGSTDYGLWQVNSINFGGPVPDGWADPTTNARMAHAVWSKQGWNAWTTYKLGLPVAAHLPEAKAAVAKYGSGFTGSEGLSLGSIGDIGDAAGRAAQAGTDAVHLAARAGSWISDPGSWLRVIYVVVGAVMVAGAVIVVASRELPAPPGLLGAIGGRRS
jgi:Lysozyme like domain